MKNYSGIFWKVVLGFAIVAGLFVSTYWITYNNLSSLKKNINSLTQLNPKYIYRKKILAKLDDINSCIKKYALTQNDSLLSVYDSSVNSIGEEMDTLSLYALNNAPYHNSLRDLGYYINTKLKIAEDRIALTKNSDSVSVISKILGKIAASQKQNIVVLSEDTTTQVKSEPEKRSFFSRLFSHNKNNSKVIVDTNYTVKDSVIKPDQISANRVKTILLNAEQNENEKTTQFLKETLILIEKDDKVSDSIRSVSTGLEKLEVAESLKVINALTTETTKKTSDILTNLILSGILIMILFIAIVYRSVRQNNRLRAELIIEKQNAEQLAKVKEEFLANMSHEIRTPMNIIVGFSEQLLKSKLTETQKNQLLSIKRSSDHLITILNEILDFSKMEAGMVVLEKINFSLSEIIDDVNAAFKLSAEKKGINLVSQIDEKISKTITGDPVRLKQILFNLVGNAIKFTEKGSINLSCSISSSTENSQTILFTIKDTGIGMAQENLKNIFEQFTQADSSVTRKYGGTGLGLAISKKLVEIQNGKIEVTSEIGKGSVFFFTIPYQLPTETENKIQTSTEIQNKDVLNGKRVLVADDEKMNVLLMTHVLENCSMIVETASNGSEAFEKIISTKYDLVLMDMQMPEMGGLEVVVKVREKNISIPIIAFTGNVSQSDKEKCMQAGMNGYVSKPFNEKELVGQMIELLRRN